MSALILEKETLKFKDIDLKGVSMNWLNKTFMSAVVGLSMANAGGWVVGGGELIGDNNNPWFLHNTAEVKYCLILDESNFGLSRQDSEKIIQKGFQFWMRQFAEQFNTQPNFPIGRQTFKQVECNQNPDIQFQFGVLDLEQLNKLKDMERKIAFTVRTDYDRVNMKGKGFVYISPEAGPLKVQNPRVVDRPWSRSKSVFAQFVLIHELGHIFGMKHDSNLSIMEEGFVERFVSSEYLINDPNLSRYAESQLNGLYLFEIGKYSEYQNESCSSFSIEPIIGPSKPKKKQLNSSRHKSAYEKFFNLDDAVNCYSLNQVFKDNKYSLEANFSSTQPGYVPKKIIIIQENYPYVRPTNLLSIFLPQEQRVFGHNGEYLYLGQRQVSVSFKSTWTDGKVARPVIVTFTPGNETKVTAELDGTIYFDIFSDY